MIDRNASTRIYNEVVCKGIERSASDTVEEAKRRADIVEWLKKTKAEGGGAEPIFELP